MEDVVAVRHHRHDRPRPGELPQHVAVGLDLVVAAPAGDGAVLGGRNGEAGHRFVVVRLRQQQAGHGVGAHEVDQVRGAAESGRFQAGYAAGAEVVQLEGQLAFRVVAGAFQKLADRLLRMPADGRHGDGVPDAQQHRLQVRRHPERLWIGRLDGHQRFVRGHHGALRYGADADRQVAAVAVDDVAPAGFVERLAMCGEHIARLIHVGVGDGRGEVFLQDGLQTEEHGAVMDAAARLHVEERGIGTRRILQPVAGLVAVGVEEEVGEVLHVLVPRRG